MKTIIYYTANREDPEFEKKVAEGIREASGGLPIISVSQKPMDFGENYCVGDVGQTYLNAFRQLLIGCKMATTEYVIMTESDCLYPPEYFSYTPTDPNVIYTYDNVWIMWKNGADKFYRKEQTHASIIYGREFIIDLLENHSFVGKPIWSRTKVNFPFYTSQHKFVSFTGRPIINMKTGNGVQKGTRLMPDIAPRDSFDYWGTARQVKERMFGYAKIYR